jgi:hypothetical protein
MPSSDEGLHDVVLLELPLALHGRAQEHSAELMREMYLIAQAQHGKAEELADDGQHPLPRRLMELVDALTSSYGGLTNDQNRQLGDAIEGGRDSIDLAYRVPLGAAGAAQQLGDMLDEADDYCRQGQHLLTLATPPELVSYRRWYLSEFTAQLAGEPATPWSRFRA